MTNTPADPPRADSGAPERVWIDFFDETYTQGSVVGRVFLTDIGDVPYVRADLFAAERAAREAAEAHTAAAVAAAVDEIARVICEVADRLTADARMADDAGHDTSADMDRAAAGICVVIATSVRALITPTGTAALEAHTAKAVADAMKEAAERVRYVISTKDEPIASERLDRMTEALVHGNDADAAYVAGHVLALISPIAALKPETDE